MVSTKELEKLHLYDCVVKGREKYSITYDAVGACLQYYNFNNTQELTDEMVEKFIKKLEEQK